MNGTADTFQYETRTTTLPTVGTGENGTNTSDMIVETFDEWGFLRSVEDPYGKVTSLDYFEETGALKQEIRDDGGLELTSDFEADGLGRRTKSIGPEHKAIVGGSATTLRSIEITQYRDVEDDVRTFRGYQTGSGPSTVRTVIGPIVINVPTAMAAVGPGRLSKLQPFTPEERCRCRRTSSRRALGCAGPPSITVRAENSRTRGWYHNIPNSGAGNTPPTSRRQATITTMREAFPKH
jgi:hypothetical protein